MPPNTRPAGRPQRLSGRGQWSLPDAAVARTAARQLGLITYAQALAAGLSDDQIHRRVAAGRWRRLQRGVYLIAGVPDSWRVRVMAACLAAGAKRDGLVVAASHATAAVLHGFSDVERPDRIDVVVGDERRLRLAGVRVRRSRQLSSEDVTTVDGIPATTGERTVLDLAAADPTGAAVSRLVDEALFTKVARRDRLHQRALALRNGRAGAERIARLTAKGGGAEFRSWLERHSADLFRAGGLPEARWNVVLRDDRGRVGEVDVVWHPQRVVVELDGLRFHSTPAQRRRDAGRDRRLTLAGWTVLRYTWLDIVERPAEVVAEIAAVLAVAT